MKRLLLLLPLAAVGCQAPCATTGWRFEVGRPATLTSPATVEQTSGPIAVGGIASGPVAGLGPAAPSRPMAFAAQDPCASLPYGQPGPVLAQLAPQGSCTLNDVCNRLERIESRVNTLSAPKGEALPMPRGPDKP